MSKITNKKLSRAIMVKGRVNSLGTQFFRITGYRPAEPRREAFVTAKQKGTDREVKVQVFLSDGEAVNPKRRFKREMERRQASY